MIYFANTDLEQQITAHSMRTVIVSAVILFVFIVIAALLRKNKKLAFLKLPTFLVLAGTLVISTGILIFNTVYLNVKSESGGPVHWHTDIEFWACGTELELRDPSGALSNKIGSATYHEHNDKRIHLEGVVVKKREDAGLKKFMRVIGGYIADDRIGIPLNRESSQFFATGDKVDGDKQGNANLDEYINYGAKETTLELTNGQKCGDTEAELQTFLYTFDKAGNTWQQRKLEDPSEYIMRDESIVPPGDCVIVEFDKPKDRTDKMCRQYGIRDKHRCVEFGVKEFSEELCNIQEYGLK